MMSCDRTTVRRLSIALVWGSACLLFAIFASNATADDAAPPLASGDSIAGHEEATSRTPFTLVQRRVRVFGPPLPPGPIPPFGPPVVPFGPPVVRVGPPIAPVVVPGPAPMPVGPTHVRVRVPYFSGDFYIDGAAPAMEAPPQQQVPVQGQFDQGPALFRDVALSSNAVYGELVEAYRALVAELPKLSTGDKWRSYLQLPLASVPAEEGLAYLATEDGRRRLEQCQARYDRVESDPDFGVVANLPSFARTHQALRLFSEWLGDEPALAAPEQPLPPPEEIPLPE